MNEKVICVPGLVRVHLIPKVASASINAAFKNERRHHLAPAHEDGGEYRWAVIRHPLDRLVSLWSYFCEGDGLKGQPQVAKLGYFKGQGFEAFLDVVYNKGWANIHTRPQSGFLGDRQADYYADFANLGEEWKALKRRSPGLKIPWNLPRMHQTKHRGWKDYFTPETRKRAEDHFAKDMALHGKATRHD